jgi:aspartate dehydrogenase
MTSTKSQYHDMERVAIIGFGAIGRMLYDHIASTQSRVRIVAVVMRCGAASAARHIFPQSTLICETVSEALTAKPTLFVECAGHAGLRAHGLDVIRASVDLLVASVGALADSLFEATIRDAALSFGAKVLIPAGALGGLDALFAARYAELEDVEYGSIKSTESWTNTHAEELVDLSTVDRPVEFFRGNARDAARLFPQNANVAAAVALAGIGFERTRVTLTVAPGVRNNGHKLRARGAFGSIEVLVEGRTLAGHPKTSVLAPMSLLRAIYSRSLAMQVI